MVGSKVRIICFGVEVIDGSSVGCMAIVETVCAAFSVVESQAIAWLWDRNAKD